MSGIEVLGLVLGAIPLLISAFEHWRDASEAKDLLIHFKRQHSKCWNNIKDEEVIFRMHLQKLLLPLAKVDILDNDEIDALMLDAGGPDWKDDDLQAALKLRLGEAHEQYVEILEETPKILHRLFMMMGCKLSGFQERMQALQASSLASRTRILLKANSYFLGQQVKFAVQKATREELMQDLHDSIQKLETFLAMSTEVATLQEQNTVAISRKAIRTLLQYGQHASRLYELIYKRWSCACKSSHCAHLWLQHQIDAPFELRLLVLFAPKGSNAQSLPPWQQQGLKILWGEVKHSFDLRHSPSPDKQVMAPPPTVPGQARTSAILKGIIARDKSKKTCKRATVRLGETTTIQALPLIVPPSASPEHQPIIKRSRINYIDPVTTQMLQREISNLCETLAGCSMTAGCVGSLTDQQLGCSYQVLSQPRQKNTADEISLYDILHPAHKPRVPRIKRFQIALKVASSHLKLHSTPWVRKQWESRDIRFPYTGTQPKSIMFDDPYVAADFNDATSRREAPSTTTGRSFVCLGIILLELLFGTILEQHELWQRPDFQENRLMVARMWADDAEGEGGPDFASVIMWCLNESPTTLDDERWREDLAKRVVLPLERCCKWIQAGDGT